MEKNILILICSLIFQGCTAISFQSRGKIQTSLNAKKNHHKKIEHTGVKEFYLWGLVTPNSDVFVDEKLKIVGATEASAVTLSVFQTGQQKLFSWLSLGFFIPQSYKITALTREYN